MGELVSIIVPVYNTREYITRCVTSLIKQTFTNIQIILVDDGSTDGSGDLCRTFAKQDERVEFISRENGGVSAARNSGLNLARGEWYAFVDSDDYISPYCIEDMLAATRDGCDMVTCRLVSVPDGGNREDAPFTRLPHPQYITGREACIRNFGKDTNIFNVCTGKLYRSRLWSDLRFPENRINEDLFLSHALLYRSGRIAILESALYAYVMTSGSLMRGTFTKKRLDILSAWEEGVNIFSAAGETDIAHIARRVYCSRVFDAWCICKKYIPQERETLDELRQNAVKAYREARPIRGYIDCAPGKELAYRVKLFLGRWCLPLYALLFVRGRTYI